jgi:hypothetical protein
MTKEEVFEKSIADQIGLAGIIIAKQEGVMHELRARIKELEEKYEPKPAANTTTV